MRQVTQSTKPDLSNPVDMKTLGAMVRYRRTSLGITLEDAAGLCGLSKQAYNNVEKGLLTVKVDTLFKVLSAFGVALFLQEPSEGSDDWV